MRMTRKWRLVRTAFIIASIWLVIEIAQNLWWTPAGYCWGDALKCVGGL